MMTKKEQWFNVLSLVNEEYIDEANPLEQFDKKRKKFSGIFGKGIATSVKAKAIFAVAVSACLLAVILVSSFSPDASQQLTYIAEGKLEYGFLLSDFDNRGCLDSEVSEKPRSYCGYKNETNTFDIDNVTLTFYYGSLFSEDLDIERESLSIPEFDVYFVNSSKEPIYMIRHSTENFVSEEYRTEIVYGENTDVSVINYNHSEIITIPQELFEKDKGVIYLFMSGVNVSADSSIKISVNLVNINYDIIDGKVVLSPWDRQRK